MYNKFERYRQLGLTGFNQPVGLKMNPRRILYHCTLQSIRKPDKNILFDLYHTWMKYVEDV